MNTENILILYGASTLVLMYALFSLSMTPIIYTCQRLREKIKNKDFDDTTRFEKIVILAIIKSNEKNEKFSEKMNPKKKILHFMMSATICAAFLYTGHTSAGIVMSLIPIVVMSQLIQFKNTIVYIIPHLSKFNVSSPD